ncbi:hypothetical protein BZA05DRAFT_422997 [Tricharina praecox]|uniref:uncharacterized protein n=1 Tax=Tricharina praecox TaxID=43433 RepID=UPI00221EBA94|nr:uncharacterized protein BZA05DRAFT_422997 [Tricharina praecox]KAI5840925.1 hypothetical protein BZA05DRAFT_422997 [Tricharina praecox]
MAYPNTDDDLSIIPVPATAATFKSTLFPNNRAPKPESRPTPTDEHYDTSAEGFKASTTSVEPISRIRPAHPRLQLRAEALSLGEGSSMPFTTGNTANTTVAATANNINDNLFLFPKRSWVTGSGASASSSTTSTRHWPNTLNAPTISGDFNICAPSSPEASPIFSQDTHHQWQMGIPPTFFDDDEDDASDINDANRYTSGKGTPVSPAFHPRLEGVYYASPDPAIPPVVYQNICMSPEWTGMSMEELRMADYKAGWKFPEMKWRYGKGNLCKYLTNILGDEECSGIYT